MKSFQQTLEKAYRGAEEWAHETFLYERVVDDNGNSTRRTVAAKNLKAKNFFRNFSLGAKIREEGSAKVFKATLKGATSGSLPYAVKRVSGWRMRESTKNALLDEVRILSELNHPNIMSIRQFYPNEPGYYYVVLEYTAGGELFDHISAKNTFNEKEARDVSKALIDALEYCHGEGIVHRDINPSCLLLSSPEDITTVKLAGFDSACSVREGLVITQGKSPDFVAPEILLGKPHGTSVDLWSLGVIVYILLSGRHPFFDPDNTKMFIRVAAGDLEFPALEWSGISSDAKDFVMNLLATDPSLRMAAKQAQTHPWLLATGQSLAGHDLGQNLEVLRIFHAKRKLRAMVKVVLAARQMFASVSASEEFFSDAFSMGVKLGQGAFATVFKATAIGQRAAGPNEPPFYAVKRTGRAKLDVLEEQCVLDEARILADMKHPNIVKVYSFFDNDPDYYYLVLEFIAGGELLDRLVQKTYYSEEEARDLCRIMMGAVKYMHDQGVVHRDLKPENLLLSTKEDDTSIRIADFGFACSVSEGLVKEQCGTPAYIAPEMLRNVPYDTSVDMWSVGVIIYVLLAGYFPFQNQDQTRLFRAIKAGHFKFDPEYWGDVSDDAKDLIRKLLNVDPAKRLTAAKAMEHPWLLLEGPSLSSNNLGNGLGQLKIFNAKRKLRAAIKSVVATGIAARHAGVASFMA